MFPVTSRDLNYVFGNILSSILEFTRQQTLGAVLIFSATWPPSSAPHGRTTDTEERGLRD